ncbi:(2Fe-2S)-binding protein [Marinobacterium nitratireducens]|uniref:(2Fe-2S)-binding protein n=1 Tax=Marinobacterium nitratireducens TaxID=518897 RepID=A0A918DWF0_9GAMM|nr:(2Fe-2S)-binding protein [Marinobacterium nitratireducens]GGO85595.1 (2Fe-2S)-binding protein [Marinobacterium nitratireducens]
MIKIQVNGRNHELSQDLASTPLLWVLRDKLKLKGTKFGCGKGLCGACTVHFNGNPTRACQLPLSAASGGQVRTIEGLSENGDHPLQKAWIEEDVPQCGYCQPGQLMSAAALLASGAPVDDASIRAAMSGNICRCGTYGRIVRAIKRAADEGGRA